MALAESITAEHEPQQLDAFEAAAEKHYSELPYHNFEHGLGVANKAVELAKAAMQENDVIINLEVVRLAGLFHDAGYRRDAQAMGFANKEEHSAFIARTELTALKVDEAIIVQVESCIMATIMTAEAVTIEQKIVRLADIHNIGEDYKIFEAGSAKLKDEYETMNVVSITPEEFKEKQIPILDAYLVQDLSLTDADRSWREQALANVEQYRATA